MLYSLGDLRSALDAASLLEDAFEEEERLTLGLRQLKCHETAMIVSYARPFSDSKGGVPRLSLKMCRAQLTGKQQELHERIIKLRNKVVAHSDADMMRMVSTVRDVGALRDKGVYDAVTKFDRGLFFPTMDEFYPVLTLLRENQGALLIRIRHEVQDAPEKFVMQIDYASEDHRTDNEP